MTAFPFSETARAEKPDILRRFGTAKAFLESKYDRGLIFGLDHLRDSGFYRVAGWAFDLRPWMKKYVYKQYNHWQEAYAPSKTLLRRSLYGRVEKIVEI